MKCPQCSGVEIDFCEASGNAVCVECGTVCEESTIVSSVEFSEGAGGASSVVGQFVSATCTKPYGGSLSSSFGNRQNKRRYGFLRSSRETTLATGRRKIAQVASSLRLGAYYVDGAHRLFGLAAQRNFTQGRKALHVACACLYVMCRREKSAHMLIDFSDVLQVNVYSLGSTFLKFRRLLNLELPIIDPSLYIHRFAAKLDLGDKAAAVSTTALRVVQRMRRDWIETGRRPAGICAAALLIGARAHGFHRTQEDVVKALRVCGMTVSQRLADFQRTPAAQLSLTEFDARALELDAEEHPPSFRRAEEHKKKLLLMSSSSGDDDNGDVVESEAAAAALVVVQDEEDLGGDAGGAGGQLDAAGVQQLKPKSAERWRELSQARDQLYGEIKDMLELDAANNTLQQQQQQQPKPSSGDVAVKKRKKKVSLGASKEDAALGEECSEDEFDDVDDADIEGFILNDDEVAQKSEAWTKMNAEYLEQQDEKEKLARARAEANGETYEEHRKRVQPKNKKQKTGAKKQKPANAQKTARQALMDVCEKRRFSKKINYAALVGIFGDDADSRPASSSSPEDLLVGGVRDERLPMVEEEDEDDTPDQQSRQEPVENDNAKDVDEYEEEDDDDDDDDQGVYDDDHGDYGEEYD